MKSCTSFLIACCALFSPSFSHAKIPVFEPTVSPIVSNPVFEGIQDMTYGKRTYIMLQSKQSAITLVGEGSREVLPVDVDDLRFVAYGNSTCVAVGSEGSIIRSTNFFDWDYFYLGENEIQEGLRPDSEESSYGDIFVSLIFHPDHHHFFAKTILGEIWISTDGGYWSKWGDTRVGDAVPRLEYPMISENEVIFRHDGQFLKVSRASDQTLILSESADGTNWIDTGSLATGEEDQSQVLPLPSTAFYRGLWVGSIGENAFFKKAGQWMIEYADSGTRDPDFVTIPAADVAYTSGRFFNSMILGLKDGELSEYANGYWIKRGESDARNIEFVEALDRFYLWDDDEGIYTTYDGRIQTLLLPKDDFQPFSMVAKDGQILVAGTYKPEGEVDSIGGLKVATRKIEDPNELDHPQILDFSLQFIEGDESYNSPPKLVVHRDYFYVALRSKVFRSADGWIWSEVFEADEHSWITNLFSYRGKLTVFTVNYADIYPRISIRPPAGVEYKNALYLSQDGQTWEETVQEINTYHLRSRNTRGPAILDYHYNYPLTVSFYGEDLKDLDRAKNGYRINETNVWANGRFYLFTGLQALKSTYLGFKDSQYYAQLLEHPENPDSVMINTGFFGRLNPHNEPQIDHATLGEVTVEIWEDQFFVHSDVFGVLRMRDSPYFVSLADGNTYFINFAADYEIDGEQEFRFFNHGSNEWTDQMDAEKFTYDQWRALLDEQFQKITAQRNELEVQAATGKAVRARKELDEFKHELQVFTTYLSVCENLAAQTEKPQEALDDLEATEGHAQAMLNEAEQVYNQLIRFAD